MKKRILIPIAAAALALLALRLCAFTVPAGQAVVLTQFGRTVATITEPGLRWKLPGFMQRVNRLDTRLDVFNTHPIQLLLGDKNPVIVTAFIAWRVSDPLLFFQSVALPETAREKLGDMVISAMGGLLAQHELDSLINVDPEKVRLHELEQQLLEAAAAQASARYGVEVVRVGFRRLAYPEIVAEAVYNRMRSEREKEARRFRAEGQEAAARIEAATDREITAILAEAYRESEIIKGQGDREAARIYAEAYGQSPEFFEFLKSLDLYSAALNERSTLVLSTDSELFRVLGEIGSAGQKAGS